MRLVLSGSAAALLLASITPAGAQAPPPPEPIMVSGINWSGLYAGVDVGGGWSNQSFATSVPAAGPTGAANTLITAPFDGSLGWGTGLSGSATGFTGGGHIGYNLAFPSTIVVGAEADIQYLGGTISPNSTFTATNNGATGTGIGTVNNSVNADTRWFGTFRGRIGTTAFNPNLLIYGTGGFAYGRNSVTDNMTVSSGGALVEKFPFSMASTVTGYTAGGGVEWALNNQWSVKAEYLYVHLNDNNIQNVATTVLGARALATDAMAFKASSPSINVARIGVSYHFAPPPPPPPAPVAVPAPPPQAARVFIVFFDWDKDVITPEGHAIIQQAADAYRSGAPVQLQVTGYTDRSGSPGYNQRLSERRANNVARALAALGVPKNEMVVAGRGENDNRVPTAPGVREPQNRRVEIVAP